MGTVVGPTDGAVVGRWGGRAGLVFFRAFDDLVEFRMGNPCDVFDDESLVHFIGDDHADAGFTEMDLCVRWSLAHVKN